MAIASEIGLTAARELRRNLRSTKGIAMAVLFLLGGTGGSLAYLRFTRYASEKIMQELGGGIPGAQLPPDMMDKIKLKILQEAYPEATASYLVDCPTMLLFLFQGTLLAIPLLSLLSGFDMVAGETQHRTLRYLVGRAARPSIVMGKALGLWALVGVMMLQLHAVVWVAALINHDGTAAQIASWGPKLWLLSAANAACYTGITTLMSSLFRTPAVALFAGVATLAGTGLLGLVLRFINGAETLTYLFPGKYDGMLISHSPTQVLGAIGALLAWGAVTLGVASEIVTRRDV